MYGSGRATDRNAKRKQQLWFSRTATKNENAIRDIYRLCMLNNHHRPCGFMIHVVNSIEKFQ